SRLLSSFVLVQADDGTRAFHVTGVQTCALPISKWAEAYKAATGHSMNYQAIGSGGGIKQITAKTVDFGASDDPMKGPDLDKNGRSEERRVGRASGCRQGPTQRAEPGPLARRSLH